MKIDAMGHIIIDESMSDELKAKIQAYNALTGSGEGETVEEDVSDAEVDSYIDDSTDSSEIEEEPSMETVDTGQEIAAEEIADLNSMFE